MYEINIKKVTNTGFRDVQNPCSLMACSYNNSIVAQSIGNSLVTSYPHKLVRYLQALFYFCPGRTKTHRLTPNAGHSS